MSRARTNRAINARAERMADAVIKFIKVFDGKMPLGHRELAWLMVEDAVCFKCLCRRRLDKERSCGCVTTLISTDGK